MTLQALHFLHMKSSDFPAGLPSVCRGQVQPNLGGHSASPQCLRMIAFVFSMLMLMLRSLVRGVSMFTDISFCFSKIQYMLDRSTQCCRLVLVRFLFLILRSGLL